MMRRSSQSGNQQLKQHLLSGLQCRKRLVADILFWDGKQWGLLNDDTTRKFNFPVTINATKTVVSIDTFYGTSQLSEITSTYVTWICYRNSLDAPTSAKLSVRIIAISC